HRSQEVAVLRGKQRVGGGEYHAGFVTLQRRDEELLRDRGSTDDQAIEVSQHPLFGPLGNLAERVLRRSQGLLPELVQEGGLVQVLLDDVPADGRLVPHVGPPGCSSRASRAPEWNRQLVQGCPRQLVGPTPRAGASPPAVP